MIVTIASSKNIPLPPNPLPNVSVTFHFFLSPFYFLSHQPTSSLCRWRIDRILHEETTTPKHSSIFRNHRLRFSNRYFHSTIQSRLFTSHACSHLLTTVRVSIGRETRTDQGTWSRRSCSSVQRYFYY